MRLNRGLCQTANIIFNEKPSKGIHSLDQRIVSSFTKHTLVSEAKEGREAHIEPFVPEVGNATKKIIYLSLPKTTLPMIPAAVKCKYMPNVVRRVCNMRTVAVMVHG